MEKHSAVEPQPLVEPQRAPTILKGANYSYGRVVDYSLKLTEPFSVAVFVFMFNTMLVYAYKVQFPQTHCSIYFEPVRCQRQVLHDFTRKTGGSPACTAHCYIGGFGFRVQRSRGEGFGGLRFRLGLGFNWGFRVWVP